MTASREAIRVAVTAAVLAAVLILGSLAALPAYGIAWDEGLGDLFFGHRNIARDAAALDFDQPLPAVDGDGVRHPNLFRSPLRTRPWEHWPVMASLSAALCNLFHRQLGVMDAVDAHHLAGPVVLALLIPFFLTAARTAWGYLPAVVATTTLLLHPRLLAAAWTDLKDIGTAAFVTIALLLTWSALRTATARPILAAAVAAGLALGTKANVVLLPIPIVLFWLLVRPRLPRPGARVAVSLALTPLIVAGVVLASWRWLRVAPLERFAQNLAYVVGRGSQGDSLPNPWPLLTAVASWPLGTLPLVAIGGWLGLRALGRRQATLEGLALLAAAIPLARLCAPGVLSFDGIRHALELVPPAALLAGAGAHRLLQSRRHALVALALAIAVVEPAIEVVLSHPHEVAHFSPLVGGAGGARRLGFPQVEDYWATGYRRALAWIETHAEPDAAIAAGVAEHLLFLEGPIWTTPGRALIRASSPFRPDPGEEVRATFFAVASERPVYLMYVTREDWYGPIVEAAEERQAVYSEQLAGVTLLRVVRFAPDDPRR